MVIDTALACTVFAAIALGSVPVVAGELVRLDPDAVDLGVLGGEFVTGLTGGGTPGEWAVVADDTADHRRAIAQLSADRTGYRFPLAVYRLLSARNVDVHLRFKPVSGTVDQAGGIVVRLASMDDYYVARANALEDNVRLYRVVKGRREQIAGADIKVASGQWHALGLRAEDDRLTVSYDGQVLFTATDGTFAGEGRVALWTKADSVTHFDHIEIRTLP